MCPGPGERQKSPIKLGYSHRVCELLAEWVCSLPWETLERHVRKYVILSSLRHYKNDNHSLPRYIGGQAHLLAQSRLVGKQSAMRLHYLLFAFLILFLVPAPGKMGWEIKGGRRLRTCHLVGPSLFLVSQRSGGSGGWKPNIASISFCNNHSKNPVLKNTKTAATKKSIKMKAGFWVRPVPLFKD